VRIRRPDLANAGRLDVWPPRHEQPCLHLPAAKLPFPFEEPGCRLFSRGRHALFHGVRALDLGQGDEVLVPAWYHGAEVEALVRAGIVPRFYEVGPQLGPDPAELEAQLGPPVRALLLIHYFGFPQEASAWVAWCQAKGLLLFEDAAQGWLGTIGDRPLGSFGNLVVFCPYKMVGVPDGAALLLDQPPTEAAGAEAAAPLDTESPDARTGFLLRRLLGGDPRARRRANYRTLLADLAEQVPEPFRQLPEGASPLAFPVETDDKPALLERLHWHGVRALDFGALPSPMLPVERFPRSARLRARIVGLPVHQGLRPSDLERIVTATRTGGTRARTEVSLEVVSEFESLRAEWAQLAERGGTVFKTWDWASTWWRHCGRDRPLQVTVVRRGARLIGLLPLYEWKSRPARVLRFLGHGPADELGPVGDPGDGVVLANALRASLCKLEADLLLAEQLPRSQDWGALLGGKRMAEESSPVVVFGADGWEGYLSGHSANFREQVRRRPRKLAREHQVRYRFSDGSRNLDRDLDVLFHLHAARWAEAPTNFLVDEPFHRDFAPRAAEQGWLRLWFLEVDGEDVAALYGFRFAGTECYYQAGRDPRWNHYRIGFVLLAHAVRVAAKDGIGEYRLLRGGEDYKLRFATVDHGLETVVLSRGPLAGAVLPVLAAMRTAPGPLATAVRRAATGALRR
jgi:dTDP-4-amino-4,6-dideoxygalactose transaminase/CelD/BcsL family acetyltransferase involved in cellulose biosynthesis